MHAPEEPEFYDAIEKGIAACPRLQGVLPKGYPRKGNAAVSYEKALSFEWVRTNRYGHAMNLPLLLFLFGNPDALPNVHRYAAGTLYVIERFVREFSNTPRLKTVLKPLWQQAWDGESVFWSVFAHCHMALALKLGGHEVVSFEEPTGHGEKTADIYFRAGDGMSVFLDIEIWNAPDNVTVESLKRRLRSRALAKSTDKFGKLPARTLAIVSQVAMPSAAMLKILSSHQAEVMTPFEIGPNLGAELTAFVAVADRNGLQHGHDFLTFRSKPRPLHPSLTTAP